ncbi:hypothetical protein J2752_001238 [Halarchaeum rubridurum]|uniref:DUF7967 domain-containing protein n=1 Tax=Halarchaeum rubridurum TaxID=489911 RepID=A0A830FY53_9EURY|nr:hypothetical protein [Halarchaeum rubridurum]MBP1954357.1 hypothetical protein [Halarchaeum rubridurum]GGM59421.1 hypothetical protein GCM10009017_06920 [Halarchaeum rubridurum]
MSDDDSVRVWFVGREYTDKGMLTVRYATPDGEARFEKQQSLNAPDPTAARDVDPAKLAPVEDADAAERYRREVERVRESNAPDDHV